MLKMIFCVKHGPFCILWSKDGEIGIKYISFSVVGIP